MKHGWMGKVLWVDLTTGTMRDEQIDEAIYRDFLGGYGLAAKLIFDRQTKGLPPLDPGNIFAVMSGLLNGTKAVFNGRWMIAGKSPLTGGWNDANCGGDFAPAIKACGYDGILFVGKSEHPVYLLIDGDQQKLCDASDLWGKADAARTDDALRERHGERFRTMAIGSGGETLSPIACVVNAGGRVAGRGGLGALMGSKNLKAVCLAGQCAVNAHDDAALWAATSRFLEELESAPNEFAGVLRTFGTSGRTALHAGDGDSPIKNWAGSKADFPQEEAERVSDFSVIQYEQQKYHCVGCPIGCGALCYLQGNPDLSATHRPEYETLCCFGTQLLCTDVEAIFLINEMLNRAGIDTISCGVAVHWAYEAYERGVITSDDTGGIELTWKDPAGAIEMVKQIIEDRDLGRYLRLGVRAAAEHFGGDALEFAMQVGGQELPMHDCRHPNASCTALGVAYEAEPTPGRHTSMLFSWDQYTRPLATENPAFGLQRNQSKYTVSSDDTKAQGHFQWGASCGEDIVNGAGLCNFGFGFGPTLPLVEWLNAATGWVNDDGQPLEFDDYLRIGARVKTVRHAFNIREGIAPADIKLPARARKSPNDWDGVRKEYYRQMGWDPDTAWPLPETLDDLGLPEVKAALYG